LKEKRWILDEIGMVYRTLKKTGQTGSIREVQDNKISREMVLRNANIPQGNHPHPTFTMEMKSPVGLAVI
jgi:hypothetical protein